MLVQHYVLTVDPRFCAIADFIIVHELVNHIHLNRTRFWLDTTQSYYSEFLLRYADSCPRVDPEVDPVSGF